MRLRALRLVSILAAGLIAGCGGGGGGASSVPAPPAVPNAPGPITVSGFPATFTEYPVPGITPVDVTIGSDGAVWFSNFASFDVTQVIAGELTAAGTPKLYTIANFFSGSGAITSSGGKIWSIVTDPMLQDESKLAGTAPGGAAAVLGDLGLCCGSPVQNMTVGPDGNTWMMACLESCPQFSGVIESFTTTGTAKAFVRLGDPSHAITYNANWIAPGADGNMYVTATYAGPPDPSSIDSSVFVISTAGLVLHQYPLAAGSSPLGITTGSDHNLWIAEPGSNKIARMTTGGAVTEFTLPTANAGPRVIIHGSDGALWFSEDPGNAIARITTTGSVSEYALPTPDAHPFGLATCPVTCANAHGRIWFAEKSGKIGKLEY